jgi:hypothetical protein
MWRLGLSFWLQMVAAAAAVIWPNWRSFWISILVVASAGTVASLWRQYGPNGGVRFKNEGIQRASEMTPQIFMIAGAFFFALGLFLFLQRSPVRAADANPPPTGEASKVVQADGSPAKNTDIGGQVGVQGTVNGPVNNYFGVSSPPQPSEGQSPKGEKHTARHAPEDSAAKTTGNAPLPSAGPPGSIGVSLQNAEDTEFGEIRVNGAGTGMDARDVKRLKVNKIEVGPSDGNSVKVTVDHLHIGSLKAGGGPTSEKKVGGEAPADSAPNANPPNAPTSEDPASAPIKP